MYAIIWVNSTRAECAFSGIAPSHKVHFLIFPKNNLGLPSGMAERRFGRGKKWGTVERGNETERSGKMKGINKAFRQVRPP